MCAKARITHLAYADDLLPFVRVDESTMIAGCLADFGQQASLLHNLRKSNLYMAGVSDRAATRLLDHWISVRRVLIPLPWYSSCGGEASHEQLRTFDRVYYAETSFLAQANFVLLASWNW